MISNRRYFEEQIRDLRSEVGRLNDFNQEVYTRKHEILEKRVEATETWINAQEEVNKTFNASRVRFYTLLTISIAAISTLIIFFDQVVVDHLLK